MKQKRRLKFASAQAKAGLAFLLLLFGFGTADLFAEDRVFSETENRMLEQLPEVSVQGILNGRFMESFEAYRTDQFMFRDAWIRVHTASDRILGKKESDGVYLGSGGQLYEKPEELSEQTWENLDAISEFAGRHPEMKSYLMLAPNAAGVLPDGLPPFAPAANQKKQLRQISRYLDGGIREIPLLNVLREHREEYLYYRTDHHWTTLGAYYAYREAARVMGLADAKEDSFYELTDSFEGTLSSKSGYQVPSDTISVYWPREEERLVVTYVEEQRKSASLYASEKLEEKDKYGVFLDGNHPVVQIRTMAESQRKLLLMKDSYANCFVPFLTSQFREIVLVDPRYYYGDLEVLIGEREFTDALFLYDLNTFLRDDALKQALEAGQR